MANLSRAELLDPATLAAISNYELLARTAVEGFLSGMHRSLYHGHGSEFFQYRNYTAGDDLKYVDWKVYSRHDRLYTKLFEEETNMNIHLLLDASASMTYQGTSAPCSKWQYAGMAAACLAYLAHRQGENVGLTIYDSEVRISLEPGRHGSHIQRLLQTLGHTRAGEKSADHEAALDFLSRQMSRRGIVVFFSDFLEAEEELPSALRRMNIGGRELVAFQVLDNDEVDFPFDASTQFIDLENNSRILTDPKEIAEDYRTAMRETLDRLRRELTDAEIDYVLTQNRDSLGRILAAYLHRRMLAS
jgi:uncharacterized protein (DUF58 family)